MDSWDPILEYTNAASPANESVSSPDPAASSKQQQQHTKAAEISRLPTPPVRVSRSDAIAIQLNTSLLDIQLRYTAVNVRRRQHPSLCLHLILPRRANWPRRFFFHRSRLVDSRLCVLLRTSRRPSAGFQQ